jgi:uncharacterized protein (TIGR01244 family)
MKRVVLTTAFLFGGLALTAGLQSASGLPHQTAPFENLTVSGQPSLAQFEALSQEGFTTVINLRREGEFDEFDESAEVARLGMNYVHIPVKNVEAIKKTDADALHEAISGASGPVLLHCTIGWRAGSLLAIERYLLHGASREEATEIATDAHMDHASGDVEAWIRKNGR